MRARAARFLGVASLTREMKRKYDSDCTRRASEAAGGWPAALRLRRSTLRADFPAVLGSRACGITRYVHFVHCAQTDAASQKWRRAARASPEACAPRRRKVAPPATRPRLRGDTESPDRFFAPLGAARKGVAGQRAQRLCGAEKRRACGRARSALPPLTCRICLSAVSAANGASYAAGRETEHRRGVRPQAGPPQSERSPLPGYDFARSTSRSRVDASAS